jgi:uncharacterized protein YcgI (DUF1989 family)
MQNLQIIPPRSGRAFILKKDQRLKIVDIEGEQVSDFICYNQHDKQEYLSSGRTMTMLKPLSYQGHSFYSNRSNIMFDMIEDTVGKHDFLLTPCSAEMFRIIYGHTEPHKGCFGNLRDSLKEYGIPPDQIPTCFNIFMNVPVDGTTGKVSVCLHLVRP